MISSCCPDHGGVVWCFKTMLMDLGAPGTRETKDNAWTEAS